MGSIKNLEKDSEKVHLLFSNSGQAEIYVYDTLKDMCGATVESVYEINNKKSFDEMLELVNMHPYLSRLWLFVIDYSKTRRLCEQYKGVFQSDISKFLVKVSKYKDYKDFKSLLGNVNDLYLARMNSDDIMYILHGYGISQKTMSFIIKSYSNDVEKIFDLRSKLEAGLRVDTPKSVITMIGASGGTIGKYALQLLSNPPTTEKGFKTVYRNRVKDAKILIDTYGTKSFRNFLKASVKDILNIKTLYNQGVIFKQIRNLPEMLDKDGNPLFDEKRLSKYNYCLERITTEIPYQRILRLYVMLNSSYWKSDEDVLRFLYNYYGGME